MKIVIISFILLFSAISNKLATKENNVMGVSSNYPGVENVDSVAYGYASNNGHTLVNAAVFIQHKIQGFISPKMMDRIPLGLNNPYTGIIREAEELRSGKFYYDGTGNLGTAIHVNCNILSTIPSQCVHNSNCGWCGSTGTCIPGNNRGPLANCLRSTYLYTAPSQNWNPLKAGTININAVDTKGKSVLRITQTPDLSKLKVRNDN